MYVQNTASPTFESGLTSKMLKQIQHCDVQWVSRELNRNGVQTDFKDNKVVAWCVIKAFQIVKRLNMGLPHGVFLEDFTKLKENNFEVGFINILPSMIYKDCETIVPANTIFLNQNVDWSQIDEMADNSYEANFTSTNFFLEALLHEFVHSMHVNNLLCSMGKYRFLNVISKAFENSNLQNFHRKYDRILSSICSYASSNPFEAVACDFSKRIIGNLDRNTLDINPNFIEQSPYRSKKIFELNLGENNLSKTLRRFWNGKFD